MVPTMVSGTLDDGVEVVGPLQTRFLIFNRVSNSLRVLRFSNCDYPGELKAC